MYPTGIKKVASLSWSGFIAMAIAIINHHTDINPNITSPQSKIVFFIKLLLL